MPKQSEDRVVSYVVTHKGIVPHTDDALKEAINEGFRIVDVLPTASGHGATAAPSGFVCVTVLLTNSSNLAVPYLGKGE